MKIELLFLICFTALIAQSCAAYPAIQSPLGHLWPAKYDASLEPSNPRSLNNKVIVVTGDSTKWGQGNEIARLYKGMGAKVYGFSRKPSSQVFNRTWDHFSGDLNSELDVLQFVSYLKFAKGVQRIDALFLNAGIMRNLYPQDLTPLNLERGPIATNFLGNYRMYYYLLRGGLIESTHDTRIIWTGSIGGNTHFQPILDYGISKSMINNYVQQFASHVSQVNNKISHFVINPFGVGTQISCHNEEAVFVNQLCQAQTDAIKQGIQSTCSSTYVFDPTYQTMGTDVALMGRTILRNPDVALIPRVYVIESTFFPFDSYGGKWDRWFPLWHEADPVEYANEWLQSALSGFYPVCATYPA